MQTVARTLMETVKIAASRILQANILVLNALTTRLFTLHRHNCHSLQPLAHTNAHPSFA